jgi:hypothetical protein
MADFKLLRISATLLVVGAIVWGLAGLFHAGVDPNNHPVEFAEYAKSSIWTAVHLGQFVGMAILIAGLVVLFLALDVHSGAPGWEARFGAVSAVVALALYGVLQAVDGVALKQAVDAWASAPVGEKMARFASAEVIRWLEWGVRSYHSFMLGLSFLLFAAAIILTGRIPRAIGYLIALSGLVYIVQGWVLGSEGFSQANTIPQLLSIVLIFVWPIWLLIIAWRRKETVPPIAR